MGSRPAQRARRLLDRLMRVPEDRGEKGCRRVAGADLALLIFARCACAGVGQRPAPGGPRPTKGRSRNGVSTFTYTA